jgi:hypothetical protein
MKKLLYGVFIMIILNNTFAENPTKGLPMGCAIMGMYTVGLSLLSITAADDYGDEVCTGVYFYIGGLPLLFTTPQLFGDRDINDKLSSIKMLLYSSLFIALGILNITVVDGKPPEEKVLYNLIGVNICMIPWLIEMYFYSND